MKQYIYIGLKLIFLSFILVQCSEELIDKVNKGTVKGIVVQHKTNKPLANVKITTGPTTQTVFTAADGTFQIAEMPIGDYSLKAELEGYIMEIKGANIRENGQAVSVVFEMKDDTSFNAPPSVPILLTPADNAMDQPLKVNLTWSCTDPDDDELTYRLIIKNDKTDKIRSYKDIKEMKYSLDSLDFGISYFWQVIASDGINDEVFSSVSKFTTAKVPQNRFHFVRKSGDNHVIVSSDEAGNFFNLTKGNTNSIRPRKSNAAAAVAFLRVTDGSAHIFTSKLDGSDVFKVTTIPLGGFNFSELNFAWSANGKELLYPSFDKLYRVNKDGSGTQLVYQTPDGSFISQCDWSNDGSKIALKTNNINGYNVKIYIIDVMGNFLQTILENVSGAASGLSFSVTGNKLLYTHDVSGYQSQDYRQLNTHIFLYDLTANTKTDVSAFTKIPAGYIDVDPRFSPNEAEVIFTQTSNDGLSKKDVYKVSLDKDESRKLLFSNSWMPDWE